VVSGTTGTTGALLGSCACVLSGFILNINGFLYTMSRPVPKKRKRIYIELIMCFAVLLILAITSLNIASWLAPKDVLGSSTENDNVNATEEFWADFLITHPSYIPGWIETGRDDIANSLDPNYIMP